MATMPILLLKTRRPAHKPLNRQKSMTTAFPLRHHFLYRHGEEDVFDSLLAGSIPI